MERTTETEITFARPFALSSLMVPLTATVRGFAITAAGSPANTAMVPETNAPSGPWQATMLTAYSGPLSSYSVPAIVVRDFVNSRAVDFGIGGSGTSYQFSYMKSVGGSGFDRFLGKTTADQELGLPPPAEPLWSRLTDDGTNLTWTALSRDGEFFANAYSAVAEESLTHLDKVGPGVLFIQPALPEYSTDGGLSLYPVPSELLGEGAAHNYARGWTMNLGQPDVSKSRCEERLLACQCAQL